MHAPIDYVERRNQEREAEKQKERQRQEVQRLQQQANTEAAQEAAFENRLAAALVKPWFESHLAAALLGEGDHIFIGAIGECLGETRDNLRNDYEAKIGALEARIKELEQRSSIDQRFFDLEHRLDACQLARDEAKRGSEIPHGEFVVKIEALQRQVDDLEKVADLDARFRELAERVGELEKTNSLEARFTKLANEARRGPEISQSEWLAKIEKLQRQVDDLKSVDARELAERVSDLEKTNNLEARFTKLVNEAKGGPEIPQSELLAKIERLQHQIDDLNKVSAQPGPQGPPGKLPRVKEYAPERVHYDADAVLHDGALWQACGDTVHAPPHSDWICIARAGRDGCDGRSPNVCGPYDAREKYVRLDVVAFDGAAFIARRDDPGVCPGDGWQLLVSRGEKGQPGPRGERGDKGERGADGATIISWQLDRERYRVSPLMSDGKVGPMLELRGVFEQFLSETTD